MCLNWPRAESREHCGYAGILCVRRPWRGKGLGQALLNQTFGAFKERQKTQCALHADGENITGALQLYHRAGMHIEHQFDQFEKELRSGRDLRVTSLDDLR